MAAIDDMRQLAMIQDEALKRQAERSLRAFVEQAWPVLEPRTPYGAKKRPRLGRCWSSLPSSLRLCRLRCSSSSSRSLAG